MSHLEEMFDDFGISIIKFFIDWKTIDTLDGLLLKYRIVSIHSTVFDSYFEEVVEV